MSEAYLLAGCRTPVGKLLGSLSSVPATRLGAIAVAEAVHRAGVAPDRVEEVIMGCVLPAGLGQAPRGRRRSARDCRTRSPRSR